MHQNSRQEGIYSYQDQDLKVFKKVKFSKMITSFHLKQFKN